MKERVIKLGSRLLTFVFALTIFGAVAATLVISGITRAYLKERVNSSFSENTKDITNQITSSLGNYTDILYEGRSFILGSQEVTSDEWEAFFKSQDAFNRYPGMSSIIYVQVVPKSNLNQFLAKKRQVSEFGPSFSFTAKGDTPEYALTSLVVSDNPVTPVAYDFYSDTNRAPIYRKAASSGEAVSSPQIKLQSGYDGMFIALPVVKDKGVSGYVTVSVRSNDFLRSLFADKTGEDIFVTASDVTDSAEAKPVFSMNQAPPNGHHLQREDRISIGGRTWLISYQAPQTYAQNLLMAIVPNLVLCIGLLFISILTIAFYVFLRPTTKLTQ